MFCAWHIGVSVQEYLLHCTWHNTICRHTSTKWTEHLTRIPRRFREMTVERKMSVEPHCLSLYSPVPFVMLSQYRTVTLAPNSTCFLFRQSCCPAKAAQSPIWKRSSCWLRAKPAIRKVRYRGINWNVFFHRPNFSSQPQTSILLPLFQQLSIVKQNPTTNIAILRYYISTVLLSRLAIMDSILDHLLPLDRSIQL